MYCKYGEDVKKFNEMYGLECNEKVTYLGEEQFKNFQSIIQEEIEEGHEILELMQEWDGKEAMIAMADWLGDLIVYCSTQARQCGIDLGPVVKIIMESNFSKLGKDGKPIKDERGKIEKGPFFEPPEAKISAFLFKE